MRDLLKMSPIAMLIVAGGLAMLPMDSAGQTQGIVRVEENFRLEPQGQVLGRLASGSSVTIVRRDGNWLEVDVSGWIWERSMQSRSQGAFDVVVAEPEGENLRAAPAGTVTGRLERGTLLEQTSREPGWLGVRRRGWIWSASVDEVAGASTPEASAPSAAPSTRPSGFATVSVTSPVVLAAPDGDTLAVATPGSDVQVLSREGNWARVRVEGWMWMPTGAQPPVAGGYDVDVPVTPEMLSSEGDLHVGRVVSWTLLFISLERAEAVRTDFFEGEPFLLTRFGGTDGRFVYVALPTERIPEVGGLIPLELLRVTARIRKAASSLTGNPIVDLLALERIPAPR